MWLVRKDRIRNKNFRRTVQVEQFGNNVTDSRLRWFGHVQRRDSGYAKDKGSEYAARIL